MGERIDDGYFGAEGGVFMTDKEKFKQLFGEIGIEYEENGDLLEIAVLYTNGVEDCAVDFYEDGSFKNFGFYK